MPRYHPTQEGREYGEKKYSTEELIGFMRSFVKEHGRPPKIEDFIRLSKLGKTPSVQSYYQYGGWKHFLQLAGFEVRENNEKFDQLTKPEYLRKFREYFRQYPNASAEDIHRDSVQGLCPSYLVLGKLGGLERFRPHFGIRREKPINFSNKEANFLEAVLAGKNLKQAGQIAGYRQSPITQLTLRLNVNSSSEILEIYKKWKAAQAGKTEGNTQLDE